MTTLHEWLTDQVAQAEATAVDPAAVRRCEADRRILARHTLDPNCTYEPACYGCGTYGDTELANIDNLNDCPELLDLAHAHGIADTILAGLDQPQPPPRPPADPAAERRADILQRLLNATPARHAPATFRPADNRWTS
ncbi:hypothetical protein [Streptomyces flavochromogenes]|uniref:hypothetical protein n=1 Tax=Streptomyces flavochromogenes TaxID=68199 RepID=UPI0004C03E3B|nr:hypothetical protein [Streptomyces flavochromogenes]